MMREELYLRQLKVLHRVLKNVRKKYQGNAGNPELVDDLNRVALEVHTLQEDIQKNLDKKKPTSSKDEVSYKK
jgi:hypothetical protein|tara:strand:- start:104 stop:322 length:219 start_codon:yes stop_codon:yes gene_type:complete